MSTFLQFIGAGVLIIIALLLIITAGGFFFIRMKIRGFAKNLEQFANQFGENEWTVSPARIQVKPKSSVEWKDADAAASAAQDLASSGFTSLGYFEIPEMPGLNVHGFAKPEASAYAAIYECPPVGLWVDCVQIGPGDAGLTVTNAPQGEDLDRRPGTEKYFLAGGTVQHVLTRFDEVTQYRATDPISPEEFAARFETAYAREMDWRNSRGGATEEEIRRLALKRGGSVDEAAIARTIQLKRMQAIDGLEIAFRERYLASHQLSALEWEEQRNRIIFIHDQLTSYHLTSLFEEEADEDEFAVPSLTPRVNLTGTTPRQEFQRLNALQPANLQAIKLGDLSEPLPADVYLLKQDRAWPDD